VSSPTARGAAPWTRAGRAASSSATTSSRASAPRGSPDGSFRAASGEAARDDTLTLDFRDRLPEDDGPDARVLAAAIVPRRTALLGCTGGAPLLVDITAQSALTNLRVSRGQACAAAVVEGLPLPRSSRGRVDVAWP
jgi:hypothetical protein